ncbi:MAG: hypothetical protein UV91_C0009G0014 [Candidatus Nomurabacteria bacterium GW2011_GWF2_43_24]|uniref:Uncharacterized protein n=1 Tax=Candidatus Nomurabacteria bacterium GW2011_GWF2_43_24 TaxID=1618778 RepID=A0A0G1GUH0_9BACT|nr:MAG: hypothetical protein UV91_C0009G0014 [Candidatus Nomurabacteria bacterium GW2011_GWF2_43_24]
MRNREFVFTPKIEYELVAERSEANQNSNAFCRLRRRGIPPAKIRKGGGAAPLKTAK